MRFTNRVRIAAILLTTKDLARQSRNRNSEHLAQRRQGRKGRRKMVKIVCKIIYLSLPNLACFASLRRDSGHAWRESIPVFEYFRSPDSLREPRKLSTIVIRRTRRVRMIKISTFVLFVSFVVKNSFTFGCGLASSSSRWRTPAFRLDFNAPPWDARLPSPSLFPASVRVRVDEYSDGNGRKS
jgi:hypothetical protein